MLTRAEKLAKPASTLPASSRNWLIMLASIRPSMQGIRFELGMRRQRLHPGQASGRS
jgi:hypothetical protein